MEVRLTTDRMDGEGWHYQWNAYDANGDDAGGVFKQQSKDNAETVYVFPDKGDLVSIEVAAKNETSGMTAAIQHQLRTLKYKAGNYIVG
jgi:hypothetical protein